MKKQIYLLAILAVGLMQFSCEDESTFNNPATNDLTNGGFIRFEEGQGFPAFLFDPSGIDSSADIFDPNGNVAEYTLQLNAVIGADSYFVEDYLTITSFPATVELTSQAIADALGITVDDILFGSALTFTAKVTRNDGTVFYGIEPSFNAEDGTVGIGNTEGNLSVASLNAAMRWSILIPCPADSYVVGTYTIEMVDTYGDGWQTNDGNGGDGLLVTIDGVEQEIGLCTQYNTGQADFCTVGLTEGVDTIEIPAGAEVILWQFPGDRYGEIEFYIYDPNGDLVGEYTSLSSNPQLLLLCDADLGT